MVAWFSDLLKEAICFTRPTRCNNYVIVSISLNRIISSAIPPFRNYKRSWSCLSGRGIQETLYPNTLIGSLATMQPRDSIGLHTNYLEQLNEWLSNAEGPNLIEGTGALKSDELLGMAVSFDPVHYCPPVGSDALVGMGLVFKPAYIPMVSFSSLLTTLMDWSANLKERLSEACLTFLNTSPESKVYPLCKDYPVLVDLISLELVSSHFMRSRVMNFCAFKLPFICGLNPRSKEWARYVSILRLVGTASYLLTKHQEGSLPEEGFRSFSSLCVRLATPDMDHWSIHADKKFARIIS